jgi:hypothetical protein
MQEFNLVVKLKTIEQEHLTLLVTAAGEILVFKRDIFSGGDKLC